jgi:hypothetical protein
MGRWAWLTGVFAIVPFAALRAYLWLAQRRARRKE